MKQVRIDTSSSSILAQLLIALGAWAFLIVLASALLGGGK